MEGFEKYKVVIYILLALLYFIFKGRKKQPAKTVSEQKAESRKFETSKPAMESRSVPVSKPYREEEDPRFEGPVSLEDLLKGLGKEQEKKLEREVVTSRSKTINYDENLEDEEEKYSKKKILIAEEKSRPVTEEEFAPYVPEKNTENEYASMLNNPENLRKVFVAQEIFTPKHF